MQGRRRFLTDVSEIRSTRAVIPYDTVTVKSVQAYYVTAARLK